MLFIGTGIGPLMLGILAFGIAGATTVALMGEAVGSKWTKRSRARTEESYASLRARRVIAARCSE